MGRTHSDLRAPVRAAASSVPCCLPQDGGFFKPHRDTPKSQHFVGSLVVCLPVAHGGHSVAYEWGAGAGRGEVQWAAFFGDCLHQVLPVTSGARVTLTYDLYARPGGVVACMLCC